MQEPYSFKCDFWSIGVIIFILLTGNMPYYDDDEAKMTLSICESEFDQTSEEWKSLSENAQDLIVSLLQVDPAKRLAG